MRGEEREGERKRLRDIFGTIAGQTHLLYSCCSREKMCLLKYSWSFSLAKLILNCSNRLT